LEFEKVSGSIRHNESNWTQFGVAFGKNRHRGREATIGIASSLTVPAKFSFERAVTKTLALTAALHAI
jgi:hypothetical protein